MAPKISVIIPIYNVEKFLPRCLDSVLNQTFKDWQAILVDDGSPDKSGKIADSYAKRDKRFVVIHKKNGGVGGARNIGVKHAKGKYIMFMDSDDYLHHQFMEILYNFAERYGADIVSCSPNKQLYSNILSGADVNTEIKKYNSIQYDIKKIKSKITSNLIRFATERNHTFGYWKIRHCYPVVHLYKSDLIKGIHFDEKIKISEDFPFWTSVLLKNPDAVILKTPLYFYIPNVDSALRSADSKKVFDNIILAIKKSFDCVQKSSVTQQWTKIWNREFLWPFIIIVMKNFSGTVREKKQLKSLYDMGVFNNPQTMRARKYKRKIEKFISQIS